MLGDGACTPLSFDVNYKYTKQDQLDEIQALQEYDQILTVITGTTISDYQYHNPTLRFNRCLIESLKELQVLIGTHVSLRNNKRYQEMIDVGKSEQQRRGVKGWNKTVANEFGLVLATFYMLQKEPELEWSVE